MRWFGKKSEQRTLEEKGPDGQYRLPQIGRAHV